MIDLNNESGEAVDEQRLVQLGRFALDELRIHPQSELSILLVDEQTMTDYHVRFMGLPGPTDVLSFPMDELRPPSDDDEPPEGLLGDIVLCPRVTVAQAADLLQVPAQTIYDWSSRGLLAGSRVRVGRHLRLVRDRLLLSFLHGTPNG